MTVHTRQYGTAEVDALARLAGLDVPPERAQELARELTEMYADLDLLAAVPLGDTPPATAFDPRWTWAR
jgi:Asp-tRNA(Asn)/Glu-tRNA(Gln) amidotransferase C subunit